MGYYVDPADFIQPQQSLGGDTPVATWTWRHVPAPATSMLRQRSRTWENSRYLHYRAYLAERPTLALCICLVDSKIPPQESDAQLIHYLKEVGKPYLVVGTKADKLSGNERTKSAVALKRGLGIEELLLCSAKTDLGMKELWTRLQTIASNETMGG